MEGANGLDTTRGAKATPRPPPLERLLELLEIKIDAFAICEIEDRWALRCAPLEKIVVHFVLKGRGTIEWSDGAHPIEPGMMIVVPKYLPKQISGLGPVSQIVDAEAACPLAEGLMKFAAVNIHADLILGCGALDLNIRGGPSLFHNLDAPLCVRVEDALLPMLCTAMLTELSAVRTGTRAIVSTIMKQMMVLLLRSHLGRANAQSPFYRMLADARLVRVLMAMTRNPETSHSLASLAGIAGMSRTRFTERFAAAYGQSPMQFLQAARLIRAAEILRSSALPTKAVATAVGYASRSHFSRAFRDRFGLDPSRFRSTILAAEVDEPV